MNLWRVHKSWRIILLRDVILDRNSASSLHQIVRIAILESDKYSSQKKTVKYSEKNSQIPNTPHPKYHLPTVIRGHHQDTKSWVLHPPCRLQFATAREASIVGKSKLDKKTHLISMELMQNLSKVIFFTNVWLRGLKRLEWSLETPNDDQWRSWGLCLLRESSGWCGFPVLPVGTFRACGHTQTPKKPSQ